MSDPAKVDILGSPKSEDEPTVKRGKRIMCDFCECELAADGGVLRTSEKAKKLEKAEKEINDLQGRLDTKTHELEALRAPKPEPDQPTNGPTHDKEPERKPFKY